MVLYSTHWQFMHVWIISWDKQVLNYSVTHLQHSATFNKHRCIFTRQCGLQGYLNSTLVSPFWRGCESYYLAVRTCQMSFPVPCLLCSLGIWCTQPVHLEAPSTVYFNGPRALSVKQKKTQFNFPSQVHKTSITTVPAPCIIHHWWCVS